MANILAFQLLIQDLDSKEVILSTEIILEINQIRCKKTSLITDLGQMQANNIMRAATSTIPKTSTLAEAKVEIIHELA